MQQFQDFLINHWILWSLFLVALMGVIRLELSQKVGGIMQLSPQEIINLINKKDAVVIDIREAGAFTAGHIVDSLSIPLDQIDNNPKKIEKYKKKPVVITCNKGISANKAGELLLKQGFEQVAVLKGGLNAWKEANLPLSKVH